MDIGVEFSYDDIKYIIVDTEEDISKTRDIVGDKAHIFSKNEVIEDFVGIQHHEEILPSQEELDLEATERHLARISKMAHEMIGKYFKK